MPSPHTFTSNLKRAKRQGYKKIRWRQYDPKKSSSQSITDPFVPWLPLSPTQNDSHGEENDHLSERKLQRLDEVTPEAKALIISSPLQPLPSNGTRVDPFLSLPIQNTECVQDTMNYFVTICTGFNPERSVIPGPVNPHLSLLLPFALRHSVLFESMIAVCRASILISLGRPTFEDPAFIKHRGNAIAGLNTKLSSKECTDDAALLTVTMLMTLEYLTSNPRAVDMHCKGLEKMLQLRGPLSQDDNDDGESDWTKFVKLGLTSYQGLGSFVTGQPPAIPSDSPGYLRETFEELGLDKPLAYPEPPYPPDLCVILSRLPPGLAELCLKSQVSVQMINLLASISAGTTLLSPESHVDNQLLRPSDTESLYDEQRQQAMLQMLLSSLQRMSLTSTIPLEQNLTSGLLAYVLQLRSLSPLNLFYDPLLQNFILMLSSHAKPSTSQERLCLIWTSISVAGALALRNVPIPCSHAVMDHALELYPDSRTWPSLEKVLRTFFWTDAIGAHWRSVWEKAMERREFLLRRKQTGKAELIIPPPPDPDQETIREHIKGAPKAMRDMSEAMGICPFRPRRRAEEGEKVIRCPRPR